MSHSLPPRPRKIWMFRPSDETHGDAIAQKYKLVPLAARLLAARNLEDDAAIQAFLSPALATLHSPDDLKDMDLACERIATALSQDEKIAVYGDYDVDGLTATTLLVRFFKWLGVEVETYIPHRLDEGYGMSRKGVEHLQQMGVQLIITVDNGISCLDEVGYARALGIDVVVTDHHRPESSLPDAVAVVNPNREDCEYPFDHLCGCGVAFKLAHGLARFLGVDPARAKPFLVSMLDLVAMGTVADVMPLLGENRVLARYGLRELEKTKIPGLQAMANLLGLVGKPYTAETIGFLIGPRLNAAGRTGHASDALELLLTDNESRAWDLAKYLDQLNQERRVLESDVLEDAISFIEENPEVLDNPVLIVAGEEWHQGVVGIVASRLLERFGHPTIVMGIEGDRAKGSARSYNDFDIHAALTRCDELLIEYGGHKMAAGVTLEARNVDAFRTMLNKKVLETTDVSTLVPQLRIDTVAQPEELTFKLMEQIEQFRPFGQANPAPIVALANCKLACVPQVISGKHLKIRILRDQMDPLTAMWFNFPQPHKETLQMLESGEPLEIAGSPRLNVWNGNRSVEFTIKDARAAGD